MNKIISKLNFIAQKLHNTPAWGNLKTFETYRYGHMFTAQGYGMALISVDPSGDGWVAVEDKTTDTTVWRHNGFARGREFREWFPVVKGHKYSMFGSNAGTVKVALLYFEKLGGY